MKLKKMNAGQIHLENKKLILALIKRKEKISRSNIARQTELTLPTVSKIIEELIEKDNLVELNGFANSSGGRPASMVKFKSEQNYIIGIDLGATYIRGCLVDFNARFKSEIKIPTEIENGFNSIIEKVIQVINKLQAWPEGDAKIWGVGIGIAGLINRKTGIVESSPDFGWENINFKEAICNGISLPVFYDNSTRLMAVGELNFNKKYNLKDFIMINAGYGIAAGFVIEGNAVKGHFGFAGEFGHIIIDTDSKVKCKCGKYGCLEALASGNRIANLGKNTLNDKSKLLYQLCNGNPNLISAELVGKAAKNGDKASMEIYEEVTDYLAQGIGTLANLLNPEIIFIGGGISLNGKFFFNLINSKISKYLLRPNFDLKVIPSTYGENATLIGAISLVFEKVMNLELNS